VLGNHDVGISRDPRARAAAPDDLAPVVLLGDESTEVELRGSRIQIVGVDPRTYMSGRANPAALVDRTADLRILLCHFPRVADRLPPNAFQLVLAGHLHDGQIAVPYVLGKLRLAHLRFPYPQGLYRLPAGTMHVSPGLGTTFVPLRFAARPEVTELVLQPA
jgi:predicted MPP superfamily phosphohydrolase